MLDAREVKLSKLIATVLRHKPEKIGITLDEHGWAVIDDLIRGIRDFGREIDFAIVERIVKENNKQRFTISEDGKKIRANHGHSVDVSLEYVPKAPPEILYHGTVEENMDSIKEKGLLHQKRLFVHLSVNVEVAKDVARRRKGNPVIYKVMAGNMHRDGYPFFLSASGIWLTDHVPVKYLNPMVLDRE